MSLSSIERLVSQSEKEGVTLAEVIARSMSEEEMAEATAEVRSRMASGYEKIEGFMAGVEVASLDHYLSLDDDELASLQQNLALALSDGPFAEE